MLKRRVIPVQLLLGGRLVKTSRFDGHRDVGDPVKSSAVYNSQYADELIFLNIDRGQRTVAPLAALLEKVSEACFMPLSVGGGIRCLEDASFLIKHGADKVIVNSAVFDQPQLVTQIADRFGSQAVIAGIDARWNQAMGRHEVCSDCGRRPHPTPDVADHARDCIARGAGEIFIQSIDRDGTMSGFDIPLIRQVMGAATVPVIAAGGSGNYDQLKQAFLETDVSALACGSLFNFSDSNPIRAKAYLSNYGLAFKVV